MKRVTSRLYKLGYGNFYSIFLNNPVKETGRYWKLETGNWIKKNAVFRSSPLLKMKSSTGTQPPQRRDLKRGFNMTIFTLLIFSCMTLWYGCIPAARKGIGPEPPKPQQTRAPIPIDRIEKKTARLNALIEDMTRSRDERVLASDLLKDYRKIKSRLENNAPGDDHTGILEILFNSVSRFEDAYLFNKKPEGSQHLGAIKSLSERNRKIRETFLYGDYPAVIRACLELEKRFGPDALTPEIGMLFSLSLAKTGKTADALHIAQRIIGGLDEMPDATRLRTEMIGWQLQAGNYDQAGELFEKLFDDMDEKIALFKSAEKKMGIQHADTPSLEEQPLERSLSDEIDETHSEQLAAVIEEADALVRKGQFQKAKLHLIRSRIRVQEGPETDMIDRVLRRVEEAEKQDQAGRRERPGREDEGTMAVRRLLDEEKYEEAIAMFESQLQHRPLTKDMVALKQHAVEKLVNRERNKAAGLY